MSKLERFLEALERYGETFISSGDTHKDFRLVQERLATQGYWAGVQYRLFFDSDFNILRTEKRF